jgi:hypothetical protein
MRLDELAVIIGVRVIVPGRRAVVEREQIYAGDRISDLLNAAADHSLLITNLASAHLTRVAELMDIPAICLVAGQTPDEAMVAAAREHATWLLVSTAPLFETCGRVWAALGEEDRTPQ